MRAVKQSNEEKMIEKGITALLKEIGPVDTVKFLKLSPKKREESVRRHRKWQKLLKEDKFFHEVF